MQQMCRFCLEKSPNPTYLPTPVYVSLSSTEQKSKIYQTYLHVITEENDNFRSYILNIDSGFSHNEICLILGTSI